MCGICGIVDMTGNSNVHSVEAMTQALLHRGPDTGGIHEYRNCIFGHRRLSILDLSESAKQPMISQDGMTSLVFNGEIYNFQEIRSRLEGLGHRFRTQSDTEVVLELYLEKQESMLDDLNGMFSIAIWDERQKRLFLARDRMGKKPLYYCFQKGRLSFSSELFSLLRDAVIPRQIWDQSLMEYLLYDFIPAPHTIFQHVNKLPAAHMAIFDANGLLVSRYWSPPMPSEASDYQAQSKLLEELLADAVKLRLIADVPLGSFLSGGLDSTLITSLMQRNSSEKVKTFSISFPGTTHDESAWSDLASSFIGTEHRSYPVEYEVENVFSQLIRHFGEPFGDSSAIPTWHLSKETRRHVTVALCGDGGDELFAGYERYLARRLDLIYDYLPALLRERLVEPIIDRLQATTDYYGTSLTKKLKLFSYASRRIREEPLAVIPRTFALNEAQCLTGINYDVNADPVISAAREFLGLDPVSHMMFTDMYTYLAEDILTKSDRMSMAHALEVRSPLLDYRIVELACRMPLDFKLKGLTTKRILRDVAREYVPQPILKRSKYGFQVPLGRWFKGDLRNWTEQRLMDSQHSFLDKTEVERLWVEHLKGKADHAHKIWLLIFFNEWHEQIKSW
ncbi:MAG: asparagine synthase (glutamine-hydrolyzing) [Desulfomonilaceae bacterium]